MLNKTYISRIIMGNRRIIIGVNFILSLYIK